MKRGLYLRLALDGMRKNRRLYLPYLMTCAGMVMMFYILYSLAYSPVVREMRGGGTMAIVLLLGTIVIAVFALLFLLYTNSFLAKRRNREFGLYNVLGMNKRNLSRILLWETLLSALVSILAGLIGGLGLAKLAELDESCKACAELEARSTAVYGLALRSISPADADYKQMIGMVK